MTAVPKRKRSVDGLSSASPSSSSSLSSRTLKRFRDTRPSEHEVHRKSSRAAGPDPKRQTQEADSCVAEHTLDLLYSAQQRPQQRPLHPQQSQQSQQQAQQPDNQQSLHKFWSISAAPPAPAHHGPETCILTTPPTSCDDCGAGLGGNGDGDDDGMDVDTGGLSDTACGACARHVCFSCSVSNLGDQRRCLRCAGRNAMAAGTRWTAAGVFVC